MSWLIALAAWLLADVLFVLTFHLARSLHARIVRRREAVAGMSGIGVIDAVTRFGRLETIETTA